MGGSFREVRDDRNEDKRFPRRRRRIRPAVRVSDGAAGRLRPRWRPDLDQLRISENQDNIE